MLLGWAVGARIISVVLKWAGRDLFVIAMRLLRWCSSGIETNQLLLLLNGSYTNASIILQSVINPWFTIPAVTGLICALTMVAVSTGTGTFDQGLSFSISATVVVWCFSLSLDGTKIILLLPLASLPGSVSSFVSTLRTVIIGTGWSCVIRFYVSQRIRSKWIFERMRYLAILALQSVWRL